MEAATEGGGHYCIINIYPQPLVGYVTSCVFVVEAVVEVNSIASSTVGCCASRPSALMLNSLLV